MSKKTATMALAALSLAVMIPQNLWAQDEEASASVNLDTVVVTASRGPESIREVTTNIIVIDEQAIQRAPGATLSSILRREGIHIMEYPGQGTASVELRGVSNSIPVEVGGMGARNLLLIDGRPAGTGNVAAVTKTNIERIEIVRGPAALIYGSQAMGGVVNVITKRGSGDLSGHAQAGFGSWSYQDQEGGIDGRTGDLDYSLGLFHSRSGSYKTSDGEQSIGTDHKGIYSGSMNLGYNFLEDRHRIGFTSRFFYNELQGIGNEIGGWFPDQNMKLENESYDLTYTGKNECESLAWQVRYYHTIDKYTVYDNRARAFATNDTRVESDGLQGQMTANIGLFELTGGVDWQQYDITNYSTWNNPRTTTPDVSNLGAYFLGKLRLMDDNLILTGGIRYDNFENNATGRDVTIENWSPTFGLAYHPMDWLKLRANVSKGFRAPTATELAMSYNDGMNNYIGNSNLDPEYNTGYEFGFDIDYHPSWKLGLTYFHTDYKNKIWTTPTLGTWPDTYRTYYNAKDKTTTAGFEMNASFDLGSYMDWSFRLEPYVKATYYTKRKGTFETTALTADKLLRVPKSTIAYGVDLDVPDMGLFVNINAMYVGRSLDSFYDYDIGMWGDTVLYEVKPYTVVDLTVEKVLVTFADNHKLSAKFAANNIFDKDYVVYPGYPTPGTSVYGGLKYEFN